MSRLTSTTSSHTTNNQSLLDFVNRGQQTSLNSNPDDEASSSHTTPNPTKAAKAPPTMLDFLSKPSTSNTTLNSDILTSPKRTKKLPPLPVLPDFKTPDEGGTPIARMVRNKPESADKMLARAYKVDSSPVLPRFKEPTSVSSKTTEMYNEEQFKLPTTPSQV